MVHDAHAFETRRRAGCWHRAVASRSPERPGTRSIAVIVRHRAVGDFQRDLDRRALAPVGGRQRLRARDRRSPACVRCAGRGRRSSQLLPRVMFSSASPESAAVRRTSMSRYAQRTDSVERHRRGSSGVSASSARRSRATCRAKNGRAPPRRCSAMRRSKRCKPDAFRAEDDGVDLVRASAHLRRRAGRDCSFALTCSRGRSTLRDTRRRSSPPWSRCLRRGAARRRAVCESGSPSVRHSARARTGCPSRGWALR